MGTLADFLMESEWEVKKAFVSKTVTTKNVNFRKHFDVMEKIE